LGGPESEFGLKLRRCVSSGSGVTVSGLIIFATPSGSMPEWFPEKVAQLEEAPEDPVDGRQAAEIIRGTVDPVPPTVQNAAGPHLQSIGCKGLFLNEDK
jgi:hypothetical protein